MFGPSGSSGIELRDRSPAPGRSIDEIVPEIQRVVLVSHGRIAAAGPKREMLTSDHVSALFNAPIALEEDDGYFYARPTLAAKK